MSAFLFQTRGGTNPERKPRVYFTCHPNDFGQVFRKVCDDILSVCDCVIYYTEKMDEPISDEDREFGLKRMNFFIVPVTRNLLTNTNRALAADVSFAKENGIPVLPMIFESGLVDIYSQNTLLGELQYLDPFSSDPTELGYEEKLKRFVKAILISDDTAKRIREEFDAYIFLSYRKKDRFYANKLMQLIHDKPECRDIAIWFDEYLTPSQSFRENIDKMLDVSKIFALLVTPNILEESNGKPNFVMGTEYPAARDRSMVIVPAEMETTDKFELSAKFENIPECVDPYVDALFRERLQEALSKIVIATNDNIPEHNYLIGLAYRDGIDVEVNRERGLDLIEKAAEAGLPAAIKELVSMYYHGSCVSKSNSMAQYWQKKLIASLRKRWEADPSASVCLNLIDALRFYTEIARNTIDEHQEITELISCCTEALEMCDKVQCTNDHESSHLIESKLNTLRSLAIAYEDSGDFDAALATYQKALKLRKAVQEIDEDAGLDDAQVLNKWRIAQIHHDIGILHERKGKHLTAVEALERALTIYEEITKITVAFIPNMIGVHSAIASNAAHIDIGKATRHANTALALSKSLFDVHPQVFDLLYAKTLYLKAVVLSDAGRYGDIESLCLKAKDLLAPHGEDGSCETLANLMSVCHKLASGYIINNKWEKAVALYVEGIAISCTLLKCANTDYKESIAHLYFDYGTQLSLQANEDSISTAKEYLQKAYALFAGVSFTKATCQQYVIETEIALRDLGKRKISANSHSSSKESRSVDTTRVEVGMRFIRCFNEGDKAERVHHFEKAVLNYRAALQELECLEDVRSVVSNLDMADLYDRIAVCYEMLGNYAEAKENYAQAVLVSSKDARETESLDAFSAAIAYVRKLVSFCEEFGDPGEAEVHYQFCAFLEEEKARIISGSEPACSTVVSIPEVSADKPISSPETDSDITRSLESLFDELFGTSEDDDLYIGTNEDECDIEARFNEMFGFDDETHVGIEDSMLITLTNENGRDVKFKFADLITFEGNDYVVLIPMTDNEVVILHAIPEDGDDVTYLPVEDEGLLTILFEIFKDRNKNKFDFTD